MKTRILAAIALVVALPAAAQANSVMTERAFAYLNEPLNTQTTSDQYSLPTQYRVDNVSGGHSAQANDALTYVASTTQRITDHAAGDNDLVGGGQSAAAAQALRNVNTTSDAAHGSVEMTFASAD